MAKAIYGKDIETVEDIKDIIETIILRNNIFTVEKILNQIQTLLNSSSLTLSEAELINLIKEALKKLKEEKCVVSKKDVYVTIASNKTKEKHVTILD